MALSRTALISLAVLLLVMLCPSSDAAVKILELIDPETPVNQQLYISGVSLVLSSSSYKLPSGEIITLSAVPNVTAENIVSSIATAGTTAVVMLAPSNATTILAAVDSNSTLNNLVFFAPFTEGHSLRMWSEKLYFTRADLQSELLALLIHCLKTSGPRNVGFMYLSGSDQGEYAFNLLQTEMNLLGTHFISLYAADVADNFSEWQFNAFMRGQPTVVFVFGVEGAHTTDFFTHLIVDPTAISLGISVMLPMLLLHSLSSAYVQTVATLTDKSAIVPSGNVLFSSTNPVWTDRRFAATQAFHDAVNASSPGVITEKDPVSLTLAASGWIAGSVLMDALQLYGGSGAAGFQKGIFGQNRYVVGTDLVIGDFGGDMDWMAVSQGATTKCNQGGHLVTVNRLDVRVPYSAEEVTSALAAPLSFVNVWNQPSSDFTYPLSTCYVDTVQIALPVVTLVLNLEDQQSEMTTNQQMASVFQNAVLPLNAHAFGAYTLTTTTSNVVTAVQSDWSSYYRVLMTGVMPMDVTYRDVFVLDPIPLQTSLRVVNPNVVYLSPTLEQQMFVIASFLGTASLDGASDNIYAIVRSPSQAAAIINMITLSLKTFDKSLTSSDTLSATARSEGVGGLEATLKSRGVSLVVGLLESEVATLAVFLKGHPSAYVVVVFEEFVRFYSSFVDAFSTEDSDVQQRLVFATNLPAWNGLTSPQLPQSVEVAEFLTWNPSAHNPAALRAFVLERAVDGLVGSTPVVTSSSLESTLYYKSSFNGAGLPFGSYRNNCTLGSVASSCLYNYGAQNIVVWSFATLTSGHVLQGAMTPNMVYTSKTSSNKSLLLYYIIAAVLGGLLLLVLLFLIFFCCCRARNTRDNHNAPKDASKPVTLIFTDIESSTALWATVPEEMSRAVTDHHRLIRELIAKYRCYEVKTIGDAFMIASSDAHASVMLARDLQKAFMRHDWGGRGIDEAYQSFYRAKGEEIGLTPVEYKRSWNGLRVRVGIHTGTSDIRYDEVTKGYDYYGETSNITARTESLGAGGQVLMTEYVLDALTDEQRRSLPHVTRLGPHFLRGVSHAIVMYQLDVIGSRQFPMLVSRGEPYSVSVLPADVGDEAAKMACASSEGSPLEDEDGDAEDDPRRSSISSTSSSYRDTRGAVSNIFDVLAIYYSPYPPKERKKLLERACRQFGLSVINPDIYDSDREHAEALLQLLAERTASVLAYRNPEPDSLDRATSPIAMPSTSWGETQTVTGPKKWSSSSNNTADEEQLSSLAIGDFPLESSGLRSGVSPLASSPTSEPEFVTGGSVQKSRVLPRRVGTAPPRSGSGSVVEDPLGNPVWNDLSVSNLSNPAVAEDEIEEATPPRTDEMLNQRRETLPGSSLFRNGQPTFSGDKVVSCFSTGNGLLFRLQDTRTGTWAFYNDTTNYHMTVHFSLGKRSRVTPLGRTQMLEDPSTHRYDGELVIAPLATEMLFAGSVNGYSMRYNGAMVSR